MTLVYDDEVRLNIRCSWEDGCDEIADVKATYSPTDPLRPEIVNHFCTDHAIEDFGGVMMTAAECPGSSITYTILALEVGDDGLPTGWKEEPSLPQEEIPVPRITKWAYVSGEKGKLPAFVINATGCKTRKEIGERYREGTVFDHTKPIPAPNKRRAKVVPKTKGKKK